MDGWMVLRWRVCLVGVVYFTHRAGVVGVVVMVVVFGIFNAS